MELKLNSEEKLERMKWKIEKLQQGAWALDGIAEGMNEILWDASEVLRS
ncbi:MAG: hypothetical protein KAQ85_05910 [Thermodesulfovibrionia bacterium]|nr:hypothetical protein [Thermodesulfovibrionia bacterium]